MGRKWCYWRSSLAYFKNQCFFFWWILRSKPQVSRSFFYTFNLVGLRRLHIQRDGQVSFMKAGNSCADCVVPISATLLQLQRPVRHKNPQCYLHPGEWILTHGEHKYCAYLFMHVFWEIRCSKLKCLVVCRCRVKVYTRPWVSWNCCSTSLRHIWPPRGARATHTPFENLLTLSTLWHRYLLRRTLGSPHRDHQLSLCLCSWGLFNFLSCGQDCRIVSVLSDNPMKMPFCKLVIFIQCPSLEPRKGSRLSIYCIVIL